MALTATIHKVRLDIADSNRHYYANHDLTLARHPSETPERMMYKLLAYTLNASGELKLGKELCTDNEPDIFQQSLSGEYEIWITLGQPSEKRIRKACNSARQVIVYAYGGREATSWWQQIETSLSRFKNLEVYYLSSDDRPLAECVQRSMTLHVNICDDELWLNDGESNLKVGIETWKGRNE